MRLGSQHPKKLGHFPKNKAALLLAVGLIMAFACRATPDTLDLEALSLPELEQRLSDIDSELSQLARYNLRGGTGSLGYRSRTSSTPETAEWIRIDLVDTFTIDQVVLIPTLWRDSKTGVRAEGFPVEFQVLAGTDEQSQVVASYSEEDQLTPRIAPLAISFPPTEASWVRIEISSLSPNIGDQVYTLQLSEILVFSGMENVALQKNIKATNHRAKRGHQHQSYLTDGFGPYLMDAATGKRSQTRLIRVTGGPQTPPTLTLDLKASYPVNQINLHTANVALSIPKVHFNSWAVPRHVRVSGANKRDFSDETLLFEHEQRSIYDIGPIIMQRFEQTRCRYIRVTILDHHPVVSSGEGTDSIGFTEIEVLSEGRNVAIGSPIATSSNLSYDAETLIRISDGLNYYGQILPMRTWMNQLSRRHDLEAERPQVIAALNLRYERQRTNLHLLAWAVALLAAGTIVSILIGKVLRQRAIYQTRERIAADLHDELGANLHAIGLFGDLAKKEVAKAEAQEKWGKLLRYVDEVRSLTEYAGKTAQYTTNMLLAKELYENLPEEMKRTATRLLTDLEHEMSFTNSEDLQTLSPQRRLGLFLFYKECLTNIIRHSEATKVETRLTTDPKQICLVVSDNGIGLKETVGDIPPDSLKRRARLLKAKLTTQCPAEGGTQITLKMPLHNWWSLKRKSK